MPEITWSVSCFFSAANILWWHPYPYFLSVLKGVTMTAALYSPLFLLCFSLCVWLCGGDCATVSDRCAVTLLLFMKGKENHVLSSTCLLSFLELPRSWPHYTDLHTLSPFLSLSVCLTMLIAECRWALFHKEPADYARHVCVYECVRGSPSGREDERVVTGVLTC